MRFLVDECTGPGVARWLKENGHDVFSVYDQARGEEDRSLIDIANREERVLITNDKDFGELVYRERAVHAGAILLRLENERRANKIDVLQRVLENYETRLARRFVVATEERIRVSWQTP